MKRTGKKQHNKSTLLFLLFIFSIFLFSSPLRAQIEPGEKTQRKKDSVNRQISLGFFYGYGYVFPSDKFVEGDNEQHKIINRYQSFSARLLFQNAGKGEKAWYATYNYPYLGVGICVSDFFDYKEMGIPIAIYGFINGPFHRWNKLAFNYEIDLGLMGNWHHFNPENNPYNIAIGAIRTVYIDLGVGLSYRFLPRWEAELDMGVAHFSNGSIKVPNWGLNTLSPRIEVRYHISKRQPIKKYKIIPFKKTTSLDFTIFGGVKNVVHLDSAEVNIQPDYQGVYFPIAGFRTTFNWHITHKSKFGLGMAMTYDGSTDAQIVVENNNMFLKNLPFSYGVRISIFPSYELVMGPFSLLFQPGFYLYRKKAPDQVPEFYQRIGFKYTLAHRVTFGISLRAFRFQVSEFIEWSVGYQLNWPHQ